MYDNPNYVTCISHIHSFNQSAPNVPKAAGFLLTNKYRTNLSISCSPTTQRTILPCCVHMT